MKLIEYKQIAKAIDADLDALFKKHGLQPARRIAKIDEALGIVKISLELRDLNHTDASGNVTTPERELFRTQAQFVGLKGEWLDQEIKLGGRQFTIDGLKQRGKKCVVIKQVADGKSYVTTPRRHSAALRFSRRRRRETKSRNLWMTLPTRAGSPARIGAMSRSSPEPATRGLHHEDRKTLTELAAEIERQHATKKDYLAPTSKIEMIAGANVNGVAPIGMILGDQALPLTIGDIAHDQIAEHTKIPKIYYDRMQRQAPELLINNVKTWFDRFPATRMVRTLDGNARAFLSDKFQPLDNYDFAGATLPILAERKLNIVSCEITEKKLYIKAVDEKLFRDVPVGYKMGDGSHKIYDTCAPVIILANSEVGFGRLVVETGVYTSACTNLCWFAKGGMKRTHVGARHKLTEGFDVADLDAIMSQRDEEKDDGSSLAAGARRAHRRLRREGSDEPPRAARRRG